MCVCVCVCACVPIWSNSGDQNEDAINSAAKLLQEETANAQKRYDTLKSHAEAKIEQYVTCSRLLPLPA